MKFLRWTCVIATIASLQAGQLAIPNSRSPDGRWSLVCDESGTSSFSFSVKASDTGKEFKLLDTTKATLDDTLMFETMANAARRARQVQEQGAESYHVHWNRNASVLVIEAGAHKFGHFLIFRRKSDRFSKVSVSVDLTEKLLTFVRDTSPKIHEMGVNRFRTKDPNFNVYPRVSLLENDCVAFNTYGTQCSGAFQNLSEELKERIPSTPELYFLLQIRRSGPAAFLGFCH